MTEGKNHTDPSTGNSLTEVCPSCRRNAADSQRGGGDVSTCWCHLWYVSYEFTSFCWYCWSLKHAAFNSPKCYLEETDVAFSATIYLTGNFIYNLLFWLAVVSAKQMILSLCKYTLLSLPSICLWHKSCYLSRISVSVTVTYIVTKYSENPQI